MPYLIPEYLFRF
uniref:Uncharacterized protein n=1 Tax=Rhizophora mucronata TaxID=61149 RepID=A0A2P2NYE6_RHIMU